MTRLILLTAFAATTLLASSQALAYDDCGAGTVRNYEWQCEPWGWQLTVVGETTYDSRGVIIERWGDTWHGDFCSDSDRTIAGGGEENEQFPVCGWGLHDCFEPAAKDCPVVPPYTDYPHEPIPPKFEDFEPKDPREEPPPDEVTR